MKQTDINAIYEFQSNPGVTERYGKRPKSLEQTRIWVEEILSGPHKYQSLFWVFSLKQDTKAIGEACFWNFGPGFDSAELGYELHPAHWGKGMMTEGLSPILSFGFNVLGLHRVEACPFASNETSMSVLEKLGFKYEGTLRQRFKFDGQYLDQIYFSLLRDEWDFARRSVQQSHSSISSETG